jgi:hypothetical protein
LRKTFKRKTCKKRAKEKLVIILSVVLNMDRFNIIKHELQTTIEAFVSSEIDTKRARTNSHTHTHRRGGG